MSALLAAEQFIFDKIRALTDLGAQGIYQGAAPPDADYPLVVFQNMSSVEIIVSGTNNIMANSLYQVKAITTSGGMSEADAMADKINDALHGAAGITYPGGHIYVCVREQLFTLYEYESGLKYYHRGGVYRIYSK